MKAFAACFAALFVFANSAEKCDFHTRLVEHLMEKRYQEMPEDLNNGGGERGNLWMQNNWEPTIRCAENRRVGHFGEGGKWVCDPFLIHNLYHTVAQFPSDRPGIDLVFV